MLDRLKLIKKISLLKISFDQHRFQSIQYAQKLWNEMLQKDDFLEKNQFWFGSLNKIYPAQPYTGSYIGLSIDGSQIYPDRHSGCDYFLINIGGIGIRYDFLYSEDSIVFFQEPYVFSLFNADFISVDWVNAQRYGYELDTLIKESIQLRDFSETILSVLDGSLIFWHLDGLLEKNTFIKSYNNSLIAAYESNIPVVGYISRPKNKNIIDLIKLFLRYYEIKQNGSFQESLAHGINDIHIMQHFLPLNHRSTVFFYRNNILTNDSCEDIIPCFFYYNVGFEIVRVEIPFWVGKDNDLVSKIASLVLDQVIKGNGYPTILTEAHHQAVVKKQDREFFYHLIEKESKGVFSKKNPLSQKQEKKNKMYY